MSQVRLDALERVDFDKYLTLSEKAQRDAAIASNDAFIAAMTKASAKGRERVRPGTYVDTTPPLGAHFIRAIAPHSACGSPAAMCIERGNPDGGAPLVLKS
ncbi:hypothetical protein [Bradyrhizobium betae]|uniref:Uncharacterized protein n=1 Tax=Bradyrhizobium betae TaxID=244734 RepID=A0A5P6NZN1_9BRAD|nr:hypothetical protein [Bradyrhizobium betae]MCS3725452.1 hypothetical protein [Bradyrhizobium betae]QFI71254.1 hypothetical protein F8237_02010 [Bradyrhizobium betae]